MAKIIEFDKSARKDILDLLGKGVDREGFVVEKTNPSQRVVSPEGIEIRASRFAAVIKGSEAFYQSDLSSLLHLSDKIDP